MFGLADSNWIAWPLHATVATPPRLEKVWDGGGLVVVVGGGGGGGTVVVGDVSGAVSFGVLRAGTVVVSRGDGTLALGGAQVRTLTRLVGTGDGWGGAVVVVEPGAVDGAVAGAPACVVTTGRRVPTDADFATDGSDDDAVTLAMPEDTPNHAIAVAVAVPSTQVDIANDRRT